MGGEIKIRVRSMNINEIDRPLAAFKERGERILNLLKSEIKVGILQRMLQKKKKIIRKYQEERNDNKLGNFNKMNQFLEIQNISKLNHRIRNPK